MNYKAFGNLFCLIYFIFINEALSQESRPTRPKKSIIFVIHEDGPYDYFDGNVRKSAAHSTLKKAKHIAENFKNGEVFIFRQKPIEKNCFCISKKSQTAYYYSDGQLVSKKRYYRDEHGADLEIELDFYMLNSDTVINPSNDHIHVLYFFGAPLPEITLAGYSLSMGQVVFGVEEYYRGLNKFTLAIQKKFNAIIQASSYGGTPGMVSKSLDVSDYYIASPGPLSSVSYDIEKLMLLDKRSSVDLPNMLKSFVDSSFSLLKDKSVEEVSISLYDSGTLSPILENLNPSYDSLLTKFNSRTYAQRVYIDCSDHEFFLAQNQDSETKPFYSEEIQEGVYTKFRQAFRGWGLQKSKNSGWVCPILPKQ